MWIQLLIYCMYMKKQLQEIKVQKIQVVFTLHFQRLANMHTKNKWFWAQFVYSVSTMSQEENNMKMTRKKSCSLEDSTWHKKKSVHKLWLMVVQRLHLLGVCDAKPC